MNIFVLDRRPEIAARYHCDKHVVKMILETAQILCTVNHRYGNDQAPYRATHRNHPCTLWAGESRENYTWLVALGISLCVEYRYRYDKTHKSESVICKLQHPPMDSREAPALGYTDFAQAMPEQYRDPNPVTAYRNYYIGEKSHLFQYTRRPVPDFIRNSLAILL